MQQSSILCSPSPNPSPQGRGIGSLQDESKTPLPWREGAGGGGKHLEQKTMSFEFDGEKYEKASNHQEEWGNKIIAELQLQGNERILDLGCGDGRLTARLAQQVPQGMAIGIDASHGMIDAAQKHKRKNLRFEVQDVNHFQLNDSFDLIFSNAALHWIKDHRTLLSRCLDLLNDDGRLHWNFAADGNCGNFFVTVREVMRHNEFSGCFTDFNWPWYMPVLEEYRELLQESSFQEVEVWGENADRYFPDADAMIRWIEQPSIVPFLDRVERDRQQAFRDTVVKGMLEKCLKKDGRCFETFRRINVRAKK